MLFYMFKILGKVFLSPFQCNIWNFQTYSRVQIGTVQEFQSWSRHSVIDKLPAEPYLRSHKLASLVAGLKLGLIPICLPWNWVQTYTMTQNCWSVYLGSEMGLHCVNKVETSCIFHKSEGSVWVILLLLHMKLLDVQIPLWACLSHPNPKKISIKIWGPTKTPMSD